MKPLIFSSMTLLFFLAGIPAKSQNFDPEKYKTERERQQNRELQRESDRKRYQEEQRKREKENAPREKIRRTSPARTPTTRNSSRSRATARPAGW